MTLDSSLACALACALACVGWRLAGLSFVLFSPRNRLDVMGGAFGHSVLYRSFPLLPFLPVSAGPQTGAGSGFTLPVKTSRASGTASLMLHFALGVLL